MHLRGALRNGLTRDEIKELLLQTAIYCGVPDANAAFRVAQRVFDEDDRESRRQADLPRVDDVRGSS
jgi:alkylhydroperoxidase/carboxymuconolactone decarboxylase family protein YurZ